VGITISIDDFGTGYSNLVQLSRLPFGVLKIDKSLIKGIGENQKSEAIVTAIIRMAHAMDHRVVAEGVETLPQQEFLHRAGCDEMQGYLHGRPMPAHEIDRWTRERACHRDVLCSSCRISAGMQDTAQRAIA
jgi:two-component system CheB/CheR fusion protein